MGPAGGEVDGELAGRIRRRGGGGVPLDASTRSAMEGAFDADLAHVRLHAGAESAALNRDLGAQAFTLGADIHFGADAPGLASPPGKHLLAHELAHVVQQGGRIARRREGSEAGDAGASRAPVALKVTADRGGPSRQYRIAARHNAETLGSATVHESDGASAEITDLHVEPEHRRQGHGETIVASAARQARQLGKSKVALAAQDDGSGRLDSWYRGLGFEQVGVNEVGYAAFEAPTSRLLIRRVQRRGGATVAPLIQRMNQPTSTPNTRKKRRAGRPVVVPVNEDEKRDLPAESERAEGRPAVTKGPPLLDVLKPSQVASSDSPVAGEHASDTKPVVAVGESDATGGTSAYPAGRVFSAKEGADLVSGGTAIDRVIHEVAVNMSQLFDTEVPLFTEGIPSGKSVKPVPVSSNQAKRLAKGKGKSLQSQKVATAVPKTEEVFFREHRRKMESSTLSPELTSMLRALRSITRLYLLAQRGVSDHVLGTNAFSYLGTDYVVNSERYVRPYDSSFAKYRDAKSGYINLPGTVFAAFDYPATSVSLVEFRRIIQAILQDRVPPVSAKQMTVFIAAVAAETTRYGPQLSSVMLALSGVTDVSTTSHSSIFTEGLTMTTGGTDPGTGSHIDTRPGFEGQATDSPSRATDISAIREGALLVSAFSQPEINLDVRSYIAAQLEKGVGRDELVADLSRRLVQLMNRRAATVDRGASRGAIQLSKVVSKEMRDKHFPKAPKFRDDTTEKDTIVLLDAREEEQLAWDIANSREDGSWKDGHFRSFGTYRAVRKSKGQYKVGRAHIDLSVSGAKRAGLLNHWEGQDWVGETRRVAAKDLDLAIGESPSAWARALTAEPGDDVDERIQNVMAAIEHLDEATRAEVSAPLHVVLEGSAHTDLLVRKRALTVLGDLEALVKSEEVSKGRVLDLLRQWQPSNEWNVMPRTWVRGKASGAGHNCLIDTLLQLTTDLSEEERLDEAKLIRYRLISDGQTEPMAYLYGSFHARRVLELIGVDPENYEIRTEWTFGGERKLNEVEGRDNPTVLRLWNTGGHYEPITVPGGAESDDLAAHQTNQRLVRPAKPYWMLALALQLGAGGDISEVDEKAIAQTALKQKRTPEPSERRPAKATGSLAFMVPGVDGVQVTESFETSKSDKDEKEATESSVRVLTIIDMSPSEGKKLQALLDEVKTKMPAIMKFCEVTPMAVRSGLVRVFLVSGARRYERVGPKWTSAK